MVDLRKRCTSNGRSSSAAAADETSDCGGWRCGISPTKKEALVYRIRNYTTKAHLGKSQDTNIPQYRRFIERTVYTIFKYHRLSRTVLYYHELNERDFFWIDGKESLEGTANFTIRCIFQAIFSDLRDWRVLFISWLRDPKWMQCELVPQVVNTCGVCNQNL